MKKKSCNKVFVPLFLILVMLVSISSTYTKINSNSFTSSLKSSGSMIILNATLTGGSLGVHLGTFDDPYLLESQTIDGGSAGKVIYIISTTAYIRIFNCTIINSGTGASDAGIYIEYSKNVIITNCTIVSNHNAGIYLYHSQNIAIIGNNISKNLGTGLYFESSSNNNVTRNLINSNRQGINLVTSSQRNVIFANSFLANSAGNRSGYAWDGTGVGNTWDAGLIGNYWGNYRLRYPGAISTDHVTWNTAFKLNSTKNQIDNHPLVSFIVHKPILIVGDAQLVAFPDKTGLGTKVSPYEIQSMVIPAFGEGLSCIKLQDINKCLRIFNVTVVSGPAGFWLQNCTNISIDGCKSSFNGQGCHIESFSSNFTISSSNFTTNNGHGIYIENAANWTIKSCVVNNNTVDGIYLPTGCTNCTIRDSTIESNSGTGVYIDSSSNFTTTNNHVRFNNDKGVHLHSCDDGTLSNNLVTYNKYYGIDLIAATNMLVTNNDVGWSYYGIFLSFSPGDTFLDNSLHSCSIMLDPQIYDLSTMAGINISTSNTVDGKPVIYRFSQTKVNLTGLSGAGAVILANCSNSTIRDLMLSLATVGIQMFSSWNCTITNCTLRNFFDSGIGLTNSTLNMIKNCNLINCNQSMILQQSSNNNTITGNTITNGQIGVYLNSATGTMWDQLHQNKMTGCGVQIVGPYDAVASHNIDQTNRVNNKVLYYYCNKQNLTAANFTNAGQIFMVYCNSVTITSCNLSNASWGLVLDSCNYNRITNVNASFNFQGITLSDSSNNNLTNCIINENGQGVYNAQGLGIWGQFSQSNLVTNCSICQNMKGGVLLSGVGQKNVFKNNFIQHNLYGLLSTAYAYHEVNTNISNNDISFNLQQGIFLQGTINGNIVGNNISNNLGIGIKITNLATGNHIYANIISNNALGEVYSNVANTWNNGTIGNCWGDYVSKYPSAKTGNKTYNSPFGIIIVWKTQYTISGSPGINDSFPFYQDPPRNPHAEGINGQMTISWLAPAIDGHSPPTSYKIYRGTSPGAESYLATTGNLPAFNDSGITYGNVYYYIIRAVNEAGDGTWSVELRAGLATAPGTLQLSYRDNQIVLAWQVPSLTGGSAITGYKIYRGTSPDDITTLVTFEGGNVTTWIDLNPTAGQTYYYKVCAITGTGDGQLTIAVSGLIPVPINWMLYLLIIVIAAGIVATIAVVVTVTKRRKKVAKPPRYEAQPATPATPEINLKEALALDASDMQHRIDEKQAILTRILEPQTQSEATAAAKQSALQDTEGLKGKKMKAGASSEEIIEHKVDEQLEQEINPQLQVERCIVCSTVLGGASYVCPECKTKYCIRCAIALSQQNENCWACKKPLKF